MDRLPEILAALTFFGAAFILPIVVVLLRHQRTMTELIHRGADDDTRQRIALLESQVRELQSARHAEIIRDDGGRELQSRVE